MPKPETETEIQRQILIGINMFSNQNGVKAYRVSNAGIYDFKRGEYRKAGQFSAKGISDIIVIAPYKVVFLEVKSENGRINENQANFKSHCDFCAVPYIIVRSRQEALAVLRQEGIIGGELNGI